MRHARLDTLLEKFPLKVKIFIAASKLTMLGNVSLKN